MIMQTSSGNLKEFGMPDPTQTPRVSEDTKSGAEGPSSSARKRATFANEAIYKIYSEIAGILWGASLVVLFYFEAHTWQKALISTVLIVGALLCITGLLIRKGTLDEDEDSFSLSRDWSLILCEFSWKIFSLGVVSLMPALAWDLVANGSTKKVTDNPALLPVLVIHILVIAGCISWMHRLARRERVLISSVDKYLEAK